ncbi:hypothetical protein SLS62_009858 [Diatrype stigma]|uniref:NmrA-like domain-containing protein n=1 Tax=Diatrype stigma TaxID=117547 RepID=A0AAN9UJ89_9PEZI
MSYVKKVAIVGATGRVGSFMVAELLKLGKHEVTAITRENSQAVIPAGVKVAKVNYDDRASLVAALRGQEVLIITLSVLSPKDTSLKLVEAAAEADVPWILPNEWGSDYQSNPALGEAILLGPASAAVRQRIEDLGRSAWIGVACGFWYEFSLGGTKNRYGFDFDERSVVFFDDGTFPIETTTWPQVGRTVAKLLSLKTHPDPDSGEGRDGKSPVTLATYRNTYVRVSSFTISQKDMFESVLRVTGIRPEDWTITYESSAQRYKDGMAAMQAGDMGGFARAMYSRAFFPEGSARLVQGGRKLDNEALGLPQEDLDEFTRIGIKEAKMTRPFKGYTDLKS